MHTWSPVTTGECDKLQTTLLQILYNIQTARHLIYIMDVFIWLVQFKLIGSKITQEKNSLIEKFQPKDIYF